MTRQEAIRARCLDCSGGSAKEVRECGFKDCQLYRFRMNGSHASGSRKKAIMEYCRECCNGSAHERGLCPAVGCPLRAYRSGTPATIEE